MSFPAIERLAPTLREADCAILAGDLTHFGDPPDAFRVVDAVRQFCPNVRQPRLGLGTNPATRRRTAPHNFRAGTVLASAPSAGWFRCRGSRPVAKSPFGIGLGGAAGRACSAHRPGPR